MPRTKERGYSALFGDGHGDFSLREIERHCYTVASTSSQGVKKFRYRTRLSFLEKNKINQVNTYRSKHLVTC